MKKNKSIKVNALLSGLKTLLSVVFPLITFPYITRIIGSDNFGKVAFSTSIVTYFAMIAALGINNYAIREGSSRRDDKDEFNKFANQIFTINIVTTLASYILLFCFWLFWDKLNGYSMLIIIQSLGIISTTLGVEWLYTIYEDFSYIVKRYLIVQFASLILMFIFVREQSDYLLYAAIIVFANGGANLFNFIHSRKYCDLKLIWDNNVLKHIKKILILFFNEVSVLIYVTSDITILGLFCSNHVVGIYSVAAKIYTIVKSILSSILVVTISRLSNYISNGLEKEYSILQKNIQKVLILITIPSVLGIITLSSNIVLIVSGEEFIDASFVLKVLGIALFFSIGASYFSNILLVQKKESLILKSTFIAAFTNIILNLIFIPRYGAIAAAGTTALSELIVMLINMYNARNFVKNFISAKELLEVVLTGMIVVFSSIFFKNQIGNMYISTLMTIMISMFGFIIILLLFKDPLIYGFLSGVKKKIKKKTSFRNI